MFLRKNKIVLKKNFPLWTIRISDKDCQGIPDVYKVVAFKFSSPCALNYTVNEDHGKEKEPTLL